VFNTTDEQKKILNDIISNKLHWDAKDYKYCGVNRISWGEMKRILNEGPLSTTNDTSKKSLTDNVVNFYLKKLSFNAWVIEMWSRNLTRQFLFLHNLFISNTASREKQKHKLSWDI
jgi:hypothetical protein